MNGEVLARYQFLPWIREGLATAITTAPTGERAVLNVKLVLESDAALTNNGEISKPVQLFGPGDIAGFDTGVISRTDPRADVGDAEANFFPAVEFAEIDFPWRFTAGPSEDGNLRPWIALVVFTPQEILETGRAGENGERGWILVSPSSLPDLDYAWRWAHAQVTTNEALDATTLRELLEITPERAVSRLVCARRLRPNTAYHAFVVPTFKLGVFAALGLERGDATALTAAWDGTEQSVRLPYYYDWEFQTGNRGDFEYLVRLLVPRRLSRLGIREIDCSAAGYGLPAIEREEAAPYAHSLGLEGALLSLDTELSPWGRDREPADSPVPEFQIQLADEVLNKPRADLDTPPSVTPVVAPPIYGRWHAARQTVDPENDSWLDTVNLDPRHRMAAAFGTRVVQDQQEQLMASAWDQVGDIEEANELLRRTQLGCHGSVRLYRRLSALAKGEFLRVTSPVHARVRTTSADGTRVTVQKELSDSRIPSAAFDPAFRRIARKTGVVRKRQLPDADPNRRDIIERLNDGEVAAAGEHPQSAGMPGICDITFGMLEAVGLGRWLEQLCGSDYWRRRHERFGRIPRSLFCEENVTCDALRAARKFVIGNLGELERERERERKKRECEERRDPREPLPPLDSLLAVERRLRLIDAICAMFDAWLDRLPRDPSEKAAADLDKIYGDVMGALDPRQAIVKRTRWRLRLFNVREPSDPCTERLVVPEFPQPMYEPLRDISQELLLPGIETIPQNTLGLLRTNRRFIESYMVALNHAFAGESLWRELPTFQNGTFFSQFWDVSGYVPTNEKVEALRAEITGAPGGDELTEEELAERIEERIREEMKDIRPVRHWGNSALGDNDNRAANDAKEQLVLVVRGDLLKRYPNTVVYAVKAQHEDCESGKTVPGLPEFLDCPDPSPGDPDRTVEQQLMDQNPPKFPLFRGTLPPDITFFGFDLTKEEVAGNGALGWYFVLEERVSEARFGMDVPGEHGADAALASWDNLDWNHIPSDGGPDPLPADAYIDERTPNETALLATEPRWSAGAGAIAWTTCQKPVRIAVHGARMIPEET